MKKNRLLTNLTVVTFAALLLVIGCKKEDSNTLTQQQEEQVSVFTTESETEAQFVFDDVFDNVIGVNAEVGLGGVGIFGRVADSYRTEKMDSVPTCVKLSISPLQPNSFPKTVVLDFGAGCQTHGHLRSGKITTVYTGRLTEPGKSATTTFENFKIDSLSITGTHKVTNTTLAGANQRQFKIDVTDAKITKPSGNYEEWTTTRIHTQIEGNGTVIPADDIFRITGNSSGKTKKGNLLVSWTAEIQEPLIKRFTCPWFSKGTVKTARNGLPANSQWIAILNFGDGTCDNKASLTVNGNVHQITLH